MRYVDLWDALPGKCLALPWDMEAAQQLQRELCSCWGEELAHGAPLISGNISSHTCDGVDLTLNPSSTQNPHQRPRLPQSHPFPLC